MKILIPTRAGTIKAKSFKWEWKEATLAKELALEIPDHDLRLKVWNNLVISLLINKGLISPIYIEALYCLTQEERVKAAKDWIHASCVQVEFRAELDQTEYIPF